MCPVTVLAASIGVAGRQPHAYTTWDRDHGSVSRDDPKERLHVHVAIDNNASAIPQFRHGDNLVPRPSQAALALIIAGTKPATSPSRPSGYALRQANRSWLEIPCRRAVADAADPQSSPQGSTFFHRPTIAGDDPCQRFETIDVTSVSEDIHTDNQLRAS